MANITPPPPSPPPPPPPPPETESSSTIFMSNPLPSDSIILLNLPISTKLNKNNYLSWQSQITPILHGHDLYKFLTSNSPNPTITDTNGNPQLNPAYLNWHRQDQLILGWLRSSLSETLLAQVVSCTTSSHLWSHLQTTFSASSRARQADLRRQLQTTTKGSSSCSEYLQKLRSIADELAFIGSLVSDADLVMFALTGLGTDYNPFVVAATTASRNEALSFTELHSLLLTNESLLQSPATGSSPSLPSVLHPTTFYANNPQKVIFVLTTEQTNLDLDPSMGFGHHHLIQTRIQFLAPNPITPPDCPFSQSTPAHSQNLLLGPTPHTITSPQVLQTLVKSVQKGVT